MLKSSEARIDLGRVLASGSQTWRAAIVRVGGAAPREEYDEFRAP
jgi:hypothetical protein